MIVIQAALSCLQQTAYSKMGCQRMQVYLTANQQQSRKNFDIIKGVFQMLGTVKVRSQGRCGTEHARSEAWKACLTPSMLHFSQFMDVRHLISDSQAHGPFLHWLHGRCQGIRPACTCGFSMHTQHLNCADINCAGKYVGVMQDWLCAMATSLRQRACRQGAAICWLTLLLMPLRRLPPWTRMRQQLWSKRHLSCSRQLLGDQ